MTAFLLVRWQSAVDFVVLAVALYGLLLWAREARAIRVAVAIVALLSASLLARAHHLVITSWVLQATALLVVASLFIVFQPEVRRALTRLDSALRHGSHGLRDAGSESRAVSEAAFSLARSRVGALIVVVRADPVRELVEGGTALGARGVPPAHRSDSPEVVALHRRRVL